MIDRDRLLFTPRLSSPWRGLAAAVLLVGGMAPPANAQRELTEIPAPNVASELAAMQVDPEARVDLFAKDPDLSKPIQIHFDATGGLWVASSQVYPQIRPGEIADDKIIVLRDTDGDGISDRRTVFADGLLIPTGVLPDGPHAAYVVDSTRLLYLKDTDGDGRADRRRVVMSGFGTEDTHHLVHSLRFGPDGCLYFNQSIYIHSHIDTPYGRRHLDGGGIWRYHPDSGRLEVFCRGFVNPWGHVFDAAGESFATDGAYGEGINHVFPDSVFVTAPGAQRFLKGMNPGSPKHCGLEILSGTHIPPDWNGHFVTHDFRGHRVCRFEVEPLGSGYRGRQHGEIITSSHVAFRPVGATMGPDGALYIADWYNPIIQHGEVDFRDERRDREHGRIWRVSFPGRPLDPWPDFGQLTVAELVSHLEDPALAVRQFARQELWQRGRQEPADVMDTYRRWVDADPATRLMEWLWIGEALQQPTADQMPFAELDEAIQTVAPRTRRTVLRSLWRSRDLVSEESATEIESLAKRLTSDPDPAVRLEAVVAVGQLSPAAHSDAIDAVLAALDRDVDFALDFAIWQSLRFLDRDDTNVSSLAKVADWEGRTAQLAYAVTAIDRPRATEIALQRLEADALESSDQALLAGAIAQTGDASQLGRLLAYLLHRHRDSPGAAPLQVLFDRTARDGTVPAAADTAWSQLPLSPQQLASDAGLVHWIAQASRQWNVRRFDAWLVEAAGRPDSPARRAAISALGGMESSAANAALEQMLGDDDPQIRIAAAAAIADTAPARAIDPVVRLLGDTATHADATKLVIQLMQRTDLQAPLAAAIRTVDLGTDEAKTLLQQVRAAGGNAKLEAAIRDQAQLAETGWKLTAELKADILARVAQEGSAARGEAIYRRDQLQCIQCHAIGNAGGSVGPNLISIGGTAQPDYLLDSLLIPNDKLKEGYTTLSLLTDESEIINGIVISRDEEAIRLRLSDGRETEIATDSIVQEQPGRSLMPAGLVDSLTKAELADLVAFLAAVGRDPRFTVSPEPIVRNFDTLVRTDAAVQRLQRTSKDTVAEDDDAWTWRAVTTLVNGSIPLDELDTLTTGSDPPNCFVRFPIRMPQDGTARIELSIPAADSWVNGKPTPPRELASLSLPKGFHQIVLAIERTGATPEMIVKVWGDADQPDARQQNADVRGQDAAP